MTEAYEGVATERADATAALRPDGPPGTIVLSGMMGTGKTTVGRELVRRLGGTFVDTDDLVEASAGMSIPALIRDRGEDAFRALERDVVRSFTREGPDARVRVIATGGGTLADAGSRAVLEQLGQVVCLTASAEALAARLTGADALVRPMLGGHPDSARLRAILEARRGLYDSLPNQVDTTGHDPNEVADLVLTLVKAVPQRMTPALPVKTPSGGYSVMVAPGLLDALGAILRARFSIGRIAVVADETVNALYGARVRKRLDGAGLRAARVEIAEGETAKTLATVADLYSAFLVTELDRDATVIALGGGVVGDTAGFAAATYLRGVRVVQVPTSLLAMVDASIGGKTGVNLAAGKNLVGAFHHPSLVLIDPTVLASLPDAHVRAGLAEVVKAGLIAEPDLLDAVERDGAPDRRDAHAWAALVRRAAAVKAAIVSEDPHESGRREVLNLGHTFAHALERTSGYRLMHGEAVAVGLAASAMLAGRVGLAPSDLVERVERILVRLQLPVRWPGPSADDVLEAMSPDKKRRRGRLRFVLPHAPGTVSVVDDVATKDVLAVLHAVLRESSG